MRECVKLSSGQIAVLSDRNAENNDVVSCNGRLKSFNMELFKLLPEGTAMCKAVKEVFTVF